MPRISFEDIRTVVVAQVQQAGGSITHADLVRSLEAAGQRAHAAQLPAMVAAGDLVAAVVSVAPDQAPELRYSLPA